MSTKISKPFSWAISSAILLVVLCGVMLATTGCSGSGVDADHTAKTTNGSIVKVADKSVELTVPNSKDVNVKDIISLNMVVFKSGSKSKTTPDAQILVNVKTKKATVYTDFSAKTPTMKTYDITSNIQNDKLDVTVKGDAIPTISKGDTFNLGLTMKDNTPKSSSGTIGKNN